MSKPTTPRPATPGHTMHLRTVAIIALKHEFSLQGPPIKFKAAIDEKQERLVIIEDITGVIDTIIDRGLAVTLEVDEKADVFWGDVLSRVEIEWDQAELNTSAMARLIYRAPDGSWSELCEWARPNYLSMTIERVWVTEPTIT